MMEVMSAPSQSGVDMASFILTESHEFITNLLSHLPAKSLLSCSRVCKTWYKISQRLLQSRQQMSWSCVNPLEESKHLPANGDSLAHPMALFEKDLEECVKNMWSVPKHVIMFTEFTSWKESARLDGSKCDSSTKGHRDITALVKSQVPQECTVLCLLTPGTVGTNRDLKVLEESETEGGISCLLLPDMEGVRMHQFSVNASDSKTLKKKSTQDMVTEICGGAMEDVKCVVLFGGASPYFSQNVAEELQKTFHERLGRVPVIAGALVRTVEATESLLMGGLVFAGPKVKAASVLLDEYVNTRDEIKKELTHLKSLSLESGKSVAFMLACIGRGFNHYEEQNLESEVFHEFFPKTPLFGMFGNGEVGCHNLSQITKDEVPCKNSDLPNILHGYTTVFVLISFQ
ncbi:F-box only protein 22 [Holothuria leucospilota]|uniref:F-box only protein 22 n=1 Tax=Holothuria leucospilota TaxID=206669 RepID=A0A9Q1BMQ8_HOLLE|nr:F-box only protein 22 [Holothuria leucospilota]